MPADWAEPPLSLTAPARPRYVLQPGATVSSAVGGTTQFFNDSTAYSAFITNGAGTVGGADGGYTKFLHTSTAGTSTITNNGTATGNAYGGTTSFQGSSTAGASAVTNNGGSANGTVGGVTLFNGFATAGTGTFTNNGAAGNGAFAGVTEFNNSTSAAPPRSSTTAAAPTAPPVAATAPPYSSAARRRGRARSRIMAAPLTTHSGASRTSTRTRPLARYLLNNGGTVSGEGRLHGVQRQLDRRGLQRFTLRLAREAVRVARSFFGTPATAAQRGRSWQEPAPPRAS